MTERTIDDGYWDDPFIVRLPKDGKLLYLWCMDNKRLNPSGIFEAAPERIADETGIDVNALPAVFELLSNKVVWIPDKCIIWTKNFTRRQCKNPKFLLGAVPFLRNLKNGDLKEQFLAYNAELFSRYNIDMVSILYGNGRDTSDLTCTDLNTGTITDLTGFSLVTSLYEKHIGKVPANIVAKLQEASKKYPDDMLCHAFDEMEAKADKPCWKYVQGILDSWEAKGYQGQKGGKGKPKPEDSPDEYVRRYGHLSKKPEVV